MSSITFEPIVVRRSPTMAELIPARMASSSIWAINARPPAKRRKASGLMNRKTATVVSTSSSASGAAPSNGVPGIGFYTFIGIDFTPSSRTVSAKFTRSSIVSPIPMIPPEQTSIPSSIAWRMVSIFSSVVWDVQRVGK